MSQPLLIFHDENLCRCEIEQCTCPCDKCQGYRDRQFRLQRLHELSVKLRTMGIEPYDLADLMADHLKNALELAAFEAAAILAKAKIHEFISEHDIKEKLAELLFADMVEIALGCNEGVSRHGRNTQGAGSTHRGGQEQFGTGG